MTTPTTKAQAKPTPELSARTLARIARDRARDDGQRVQAAILLDAHTHDGHIDPNRVRVTLTNGAGLLDVWPYTVGRAYTALLAESVIVPAGWTVNTDRRSGNAGKPLRTYRLRRDTP